MLPSDGDTWTENNNATYTWKFHSYYKDNMGWSTVAKKGTYSLNVTHTNTLTSHMYFRLVLDKSYNVNPYDGLYFWLRVTSPDPGFYITVYVFSVDVNWDSANRFEMLNAPNCAPINNSWTKFFVPLRLFHEVPVASWSGIRIIYFAVLGVGYGDGTEILIDNLTFRNFDITSKTPLVDDTKIMPNAWHFLANGEYEKTYQSRTYTSLHGAQKISDSSFTYDTLESEVLGQAVFALSLTYNYSKVGLYLEKAKEYADWLLHFQEKTPDHEGRGGFHDYYSGVWSKDMNTEHQGWILAGLSYLYGQTANSTYSNASKLLRRFLIDTMWNSSLNVFNSKYDNDTGTVEYSVYAPMKDGAVSLGLSYYLRFVEFNATAKACLDKVLTVALTTIDYQRSWAFASRLEDTFYQYWGLYGAYKATGNFTYRDALFNGTDLLLTKKTQAPTVNGSMPRYASRGGSWYGSLEHLDNCGLHVALPLLFLANEIQANSNYVTLAGLSLFNFLLETQTNQGGWRRNTADASDIQSLASSFFVIAALQLYLNEKSYSDPYILTLESTGDASIESLTYAYHRLNATLSGSPGAVSYVKVYCGSEGKPTRVWINGLRKLEGTVWSYDSSSMITTLNVSSTISAEIIIDWNIPVADILTLHTMKNGFRIASNITLFDENKTEIETVNTFVGSYSWLLHFGVYYVQANISYNSYTYTSNQIQIDLESYTMLPIDFLFSNLTISCTDINNYPLENCTVLFRRGGEVHILYTNNLGETTLETYYGNWSIYALWMNTPVGETTIEVSRPETKVKIQCYVGDFAVVVADQNGKWVSSNVTLKNPIYGLLFSDHIDEEQKNLTFARIPLIMYELEVEGDFGAQSFEVSADSTREIRVEVIKATDAALYTLIGALVVSTGSIAVWILVRRKRSKNPPIASAYKKVDNPKRFLNLVNAVPKNMPRTDSSNNPTPAPFSFLF